jgi:dephospho-CoA kinase
MLKIGLTGSIASGKSEVARVLQRRGIPVFDADATVHAIYADGTGAKALRTLVPEAIEGDTVNRMTLSARIARDPTLLQRIETVIHPLVRQHRQRFLATAQAANARAIVYDIPMLFETDQQKDCDAVLVVSTSPDIQMERALQRPGMTPEKLEFIRSRQMPDTEKRARADAVIENTGTLAELAVRTDVVFEDLLRKLEQERD